MNESEGEGIGAGKEGTRSVGLIRCKISTNMCGRCFIMDGKGPIWELGSEYKRENKIRLRNH